VTAPFGMNGSSLPPFPRCVLQPHGSCAKPLFRISDFIGPLPGVMDRGTKVHQVVLPLLDFTQKKHKRNLQKDPQLGIVQGFHG
jgi:hypothetical protein